MMRASTSGRVFKFRFLAAIVLIGAALDAFASQATVRRVMIESDGWELIGDLQLPHGQPARAIAVLLHKAAGDRAAYTRMAQTLAEHGIASIRVDLRGHGESINRGAFDPEISRYFDRDDPAVVANFELIRAGDQDVVAILHWLDAQPVFADFPLVMMGASYTGEEMAQATAATRWADVYVALAPGNFSDDSIAAVDESGAPWLFVRAEIELPFFPELFQAIRDGSETAEIRVLAGRGHATDLFDHNPDLHFELMDWIDRQLKTLEDSKHRKRTE